MNKQIWKYALGMHDLQEVAMPRGAAILSVAEQNGHLCLWAMVDADAPRENRMIAIVGTGNPIPSVDGLELRFIGTSVIPPFVWHVFELVQFRVEKECRDVVPNPWNWQPLPEPPEGE